MSETTTTNVREVGADRAAAGYRDLASALRTAVADADNGEMPRVLSRLRAVNRLADRWRDGDGAQPRGAKGEG